MVRPVVRRLLAAAVRQRHPSRSPADDTRSVAFVLAHAWGTGGTIRATFTTAEALARDRDVVVVSLVRRRRRPGLALPTGVRVIAVDDQVKPAGRSLVERVLRRLPSVTIASSDRLSRHCSLWTDVQLVRVLRALDADVIVTTRPSLTAALVRLRPPGIKLLAQEHLNLAARHRRGAAARLAAYAQLDGLVTLTEGDRAAYAGALPGLRVWSIPNAIPHLPKASAAREPVVLSVGRLNRQKAQARLIDAFAEVADAQPDWRLRICGDGPQRQPLLEQIDALGLADRVTLLGNVRHIEREYARASVFALTSRFEGFPMVLLEAMSRGVPVISMDCPTGPGELIDDGRNGVLVPDGDVARLAQGLDRLMGDPARREQLARGAADTARQYETPMILDRWRELLTRL